ncbi:MAG: lamin tail domain-containing protein [Clostridia bacterium]|nr:lamin tail domain-containing protein [Clostridia bacterium]
MPQMIRGKKETSRRSRRRYDFRAPLLVVFAAFLLFMVVVCPLMPVDRAMNAAGSGTGTYKGLVISEVMSANGSALPDDQGNFSDWVEIANLSDEDISLYEITLSDRSDKAKFIFPDVILPAGERVLVFCDNTNQNQPDKTYHAKFKLSSTKDAVYMFNPAGYAIDSVVLPTLNTNESYARMEDGSFEITSQYSPGYPNTEDGHVAYLSHYTITANTLRINEVIAAPRSGLRDEDGELSDWIEIYNASDERIALEHYALSDDEDDLTKWFFPKGAYIDPGRYYIVFCSGKDRTGSETGYPHTSFRLSAEGETITLSNAIGQMVDRVVYDNLPVDCSYGRDMTGNFWQIFTLATPGAANNEAGANLADEYLRGLNRTRVYLSEVMSSNDHVTAIAGTENKDWCEIWNAGTETVDISGWGLSDNINWPRKWQFPEGTVIWPGEHKLVMLDGRNTVDTQGAMHASYRLVRAGGETLTLSDSSGTILDKLYLPEIPTDYSYGRSFGTDGFFYYDAPSPGGPNGTGFRGFSDPPALDLPGGLYEGNVTVSIQVPRGTVVYYTLDGSLPTVTKGTQYTGPIRLTNTSVIRARAFETGRQPSETVSATYVLKTYFTLPVVCLTTDPDGLWNGSTGIFAVGDGIDILQYEGIPFRNPKPVYALMKEQKVRVEAYAEMFEQDGTTVFSQGVEFGIMGQYSLDMPQKTLKVLAKARYGSKYINGRLFPDRDFDQYRSFVLRNSGNDCVWTRMADGVQSRLTDMLDTTVIHQAWRPVIVYINGVYWGHYNLRERVSEYFVAQHEGLELNQAKSIDVLESNGTKRTQINNGSNEEWKAFINKVKTLSPGKNEEDLQYILDRVDVDNYFDYVILESFFANTDTGNIRYYKVPGGKWRWILYDMDYGLFNANSNGIANYLNPKGHGANDDIDNSLILKLLENRDMLDKFLTRFGEIFRTFTTDVIIAQIDECYAVLEPEMDMHYDRWASENLKSISFDQPQSKDGCLRYWRSRVERMRNVARKRPAYCWRQVAEWFKLTDAQMTEYFGPIPLIPRDATWDSDKAKNNGMTYLYGSSWQKLYP